MHPLTLPPGGFTCIRSRNIPKVNLNNAAISVLAGTWNGKKSRLMYAVPLQILQVTLAPNALLTVPVSAAHTAIA
jgi:redox-sensitive bicupin YhaK (pirin superfamily)